MSGVAPYHREFKEHPAMADFCLPIQRKVGNAVLCSPEWSRVSDKLALTATAERHRTFLHSYFSAVWGSYCHARFPTEQSYYSLLGVWKVTSC